MRKNIGNPAKYLTFALANSIIPHNNINEEGYGSS